MANVKFKYQHNHEYRPCQQRTNESLSLGDRAQVNSYTYRTIMCTPTVRIFVRWVYDSTCPCCLYISSIKNFEMMDSLTALSLVAAASREDGYEAYEVTESFDKTTGDDKVHYNKGANCYTPLFCVCSVPCPGPCTTTRFHSPPRNGVRIRAQCKVVTARPTSEGGGHMEVCVGGEFQICCLVSTKLVLVMTANRKFG